jgi:hypothetical protein
MADTWPMAASAWRFVLRVRYGVLLIVFAAAFNEYYRLRFGDWLLLEFAGRVALHHPGYEGGWSGFLHLYSQMPKMQIGPPAVLLAIPTQLLNPSDGNIVAAFTMMVAGVGCLALVEAIARAVGVPAARTRPAILIAGLLFLPLWRNLAMFYMHLDDVLVLTALLAAVLFVVKQRWWAVALLLGTAVATKPWALVVVPILFALPRRDVARTGLLAFGTALLWWVPFLLADPSAPGALARVHMPVEPASTFHLLGPLGRGHLYACMPGSMCVPNAPGWMRPVQLILGFALATLAVRRGRWLAAPLVGLAARVLLDSQTWAYYGVGPVLAALMWDVARGRRIPRWALLVAAGEYAHVVISNDTACALIRVAMCAVVIGWFAVRRGDAHSHAREAFEERDTTLHAVPA